MSAKTLVTTPNSDVIYAMGYLDLGRDGPMVIEAPPGLQGILDDFWQRPTRMVGQFEGRDWSGDVGLPGPDKGKGGKYLVVPPDHAGEAPAGDFTHRSRTYGVFVSWRGSFQDPRELEGPVKFMERTKIYPLGREATARPMQSPDASGVPVNMLFPRDAGAFDMLKRAIDDEYVDPMDMDMRGMLAAIGIIKGAPSKPGAAGRVSFDKAAHRALEMARYTLTEDLGRRPGGKWYKDRRWIKIFPPSPGDLPISVVGRTTLGRGLAAGQEVAPPGGQGGGGDAQLTREQFEVLAAEEAEHGLGLALGGKASAVAGIRGGCHGEGPWDGRDVVPARCPTEPWSGGAG
jgi:hypothetical protein